MSTEAGKQFKGTHYISISDREKMEVRGVTDVVSFDESAVVLNTVCGTLAVEGASLHIHVLDIAQGVVSMEGRVDAIGYYEAESDEKKRGNGFLGKLFR